MFQKQVIAFIRQRKITIKKAVGFLLLLIGLTALLTPFTPGSWLIFIGLEFLGIRILFLDKIKDRLKKFKKIAGKE